MVEQLDNLIKLPEDIELEKLKRLKLSKDDGDWIGRVNKGEIVDIANLKTNKENREFNEKFLELVKLVNKLMVKFITEKSKSDQDINRKKYLREVDKVQVMNDEERISQVKNYDEKKVVAELLFYSALVNQIIDNGIFPPMK
jgi:hypothetical protein